MIPEFDKNGNVPIGCHIAELNEYKQRFLIDFPESDTRPYIFNDFIGFLGFIYTFRLGIKKWMVGSYTSNKLNPSDIDMVVLFDAIKYNGHPEKSEFNQIFLRSNGYKVIHHHTIYIPVYPENHHLFNPITSSEIQRWKKRFTMDRSDNERGLVVIDMLSDEYKKYLLKEVYGE